MTDRLVYRTSRLTSSWAETADREEAEARLMPLGGPLFEYVRLGSRDEVALAIAGCEGRHVQQAVYSTFMGALTQVCFTERVIRGMIEWEGNCSWLPV